jgi:hypothetical protein
MALELIRDELFSSSSEQSWMTAYCTAARSSLSTQLFIPVARLTPVEVGSGASMVFTSKKVVNFMIVRFFLCRRQ